MKKILLLLFFVFLARVALGKTEVKNEVVGTAGYEMTEEEKEKLFKENPEEAQKIIDFLKVDPDDSESLIDAFDGMMKLTEEQKRKLKKENPENADEIIKYLDNYPFEERERQFNTKMNYLSQVTQSITLKSDEVIEGNIIEMTGDYIIINLEGKEVTINSGEIENIGYNMPADIPAIQGHKGVGVIKNKSLRPI